MTEHRVGQSLCSFVQIRFRNDITSRYWQDGLFDPCLFQPSSLVRAGRIARAIIEIEPKERECDSESLQRRCPVAEPDDSNHDDEHPLDQRRDRVCDRRDDREKNEGEKAWNFGG